MSTPGEFVRSATSSRPSVGVVLGSGLGAFTSLLHHTIRIPYSEIPDFPVSTALGHASELVIGTLGESGTDTTEVSVLSGRFHLYEGYTSREAASGIRLLHDLGVRKVILTCAAGGLNVDFAEGALVLISDHINLQGANPLIGENDENLGPRFPDMTEAYSRSLRQIARQTAHELGVVLHEGVYASVLGPSYETPAEIRFLKTIGADLVGMSIVSENIAANHLGMEVLGIACVTNLAAGIAPGKLVHTEVLAIAEQISGTFLKLLGSLVPRLSRS
jgi:purine-nucleoside phosphorylase